MQLCQRQVFTGVCWHDLCVLHDLCQQLRPDKAHMHHNTTHRWSKKFGRQSKNRGTGENGSWLSMAMGGIQDLHQGWELMQHPMNQQQMCMQWLHLRMSTKAASCRPGSIRTACCKVLYIQPVARYCTYSWQSSLNPQNRFYPNTHSILSQADSTLATHLLNCTLYLEGLMVRTMPSAAVRVPGWRATTDWPTRRGRGMSVGTSPPTPPASYTARMRSLHIQVHRRQTQHQPPHPTGTPHKCLVQQHNITKTGLYPLALPAHVQRANMAAGLYSPVEYQQQLMHICSEPIPASPPLPRVPAPMCAPPAPVCTCRPPASASPA